MNTKRKRTWMDMIEHPLTTLIGLMTLATMLGGAVVGVVSFFVTKSDYRRDKLWHDFMHQNIRVERLKDEVDRYNIIEMVLGTAAMTKVDIAEKKLFEEKLKEANKKLDKAQEEAKTASDTPK